MTAQASNTQHKIKLTSGEIANIWTSYQNDTLSFCTISSYLEHTEDAQTRSVLEYALQLAQAHIGKLTSFFQEEQYPVPHGFSAKADLNKGAPRLYTDDFYLFYIQNIGKIGLRAYTIFLSNSARLDLCEYYTECLNESAKLFNKATEVMLSKGTFIRSPYIPDYKEIKYAQKQSYLAGWFAERRPLNVIEITNIYFNLIQNQLGRTLLMGFSQVASTQQLRNYFIRGRDISDKHVEIFGSILSEEYLPSASAWSTLPTESTVSPFSDKLMMFHVTSLNSGGIGNYGLSAGTVPRRDLGAVFIRLMAEVMKYAEDGANILIDNGWFELPPEGVDRDKLAHSEK